MCNACRAEAGTRRALSLADLFGETLAVALTLDKALGIHQPALLLRSYRAGLLAQNVANADTPHYKARDIDFRETLARLTDGPRGAEAMSVTHPRHLRPTDAGPDGVRPRFRVPLQPSVDGNTVDSHLEKAAYVENALRYEASLTFLTGKIKTLRRAISGGES